MTSQPPAAAPSILVVEAPAGAARRAHLEALAAAGAGWETHVVSARLDLQGAWAGVHDLFRAFLPRLRAEAPELLERHSYELASVLQELKAELPRPSVSLTDSVPESERVRSYPMDRAFRMPQGLIDLLNAWRSRPGSAPLWIAWDDFERCGALVRRFVLELARRKTAGWRLHLVLGVEPGHRLAETVAALPGAIRERVDLPGDPPPDPAAATREAAELERFVEANPSRSMFHLPRLIYLWRHSPEPERAFRWETVLLGLYNHYGFYEDALEVGRPVLENLETAIRVNGVFGRWDIVSAFFNALVALDRAEEAARLVTEEALGKVDADVDLISIHYTLAMLLARFLPRKDFARAVEHLELSQQAVERAHLPEETKHFVSVFNINGLAFIRFRQGDTAEAVRLCREGFERLRRHLGAEQHRLHRSVLLYNIAQVFAYTRSNEEALLYYTQAIEMDPSYSEYYNERGNVYLQAGQPERAVPDYQRAVQLSPPYPEVWINLGQALNLLGRHEEAAAAYGQALDLDPKLLLPRLGRAQAYEAAGRPELAMADYDEALRLDPAQPHALSNRAALRYETGRLEDALADLDAALALAPDDPDLHHNRGIARADLGQVELALEDYGRYLELRPDAEDRAEVEARIAGAGRLAGEPSAEAPGPIYGRSA